MAARESGITRERIDELLRFLPGFAIPGRRFTVRWAGGEPTGDGAVTFPHPEYEADVVEFFRLAGQPWWTDLRYATREARCRLEDVEFLGRCTLAELRTMLTACVRSERFCDGSWERLLESGVILGLLRRLAELRELTPPVS